MTSENKDKSSDHLKRRKHRSNGFEEWGGYMESKKTKLAAQFSDQRQIESEDRAIHTDIFKGVSIFVNGYTKPTAEELKRMMMIHGGTYHYYYSSTKTTHIIASNLPQSKIKNLKNEVVVKPEWITDSIKAGRLLPNQEYLLYTPEFTHQQQRLNFENFVNSKSVPNGTNSSHSYSKTSLSYSSNICDKKDIANGEHQPLHKSPIKNKDEFSSSSNNNTSITAPSNNECPMTAGQPGFLSEFYSHSRLHHISTAGQNLKQYVQSLLDNQTSNTFTGRENLKKAVNNGTIPALQREIDISIDNPLNTKKDRTIMHLDMDCFFVSVGLRKYPELKGKPVAVTHSKGKRGGAQEGSDINFEASYYTNHSKKKLEGITSLEHDGLDEFEIEEYQKNSVVSKHSKDYGSMSEIASCSYEARKAGIKNGMFLGEALRHCPNLKTIPYDFDAYSEVSKQLYDIVASYTLDIEAVSCDELYIDCSEIVQEIGISPLQFASILRMEIEQKTGCTASAGLGPNMLLARLATKVAKPNGQYFLPKENVHHFIAKQKIKDLPGVGYATYSKFKHLGVFTCEDLQSWSLSKLQQEFGPKTGQTLYNRCRGKDDRILQLHKQRKSVSAEINYGIRFENDEDVYKFLNELSIEVVNRLRQINSKGKSITLKLMVRHPDAPIQTAKFMGHGVCEHISKSVLLKTATDDPVRITNECSVLARSLKIKPEDYRGVGIQISKLEAARKEKGSFKSIESFLCLNSNNSENSNSNKDMFNSKELYPGNKTASTKYSVKDLLPDIISSNEENFNQPPDLTIDETVFTSKELQSENKPVSKDGPTKDLLPNKMSSNVQSPSYQPPHLALDELDQSVLNALPKDLQQEILEMCGNKNLDWPISALEHSEKSYSSVSKSSKGSSKKETNSKSNELGKQSTLYDSLIFAKQTSCSVIKKKASIGGAETLDEVRSLVKEWVLSSQVVLDEDIDKFRDYILQVIDEDLKKVDLILKYFHRIVSTANNLWQQAYLTILSYVQQKMLQKYGVMLEAKSYFSS